MTFYFFKNKDPKTKSRRGHVGYAVQQTIYDKHCARNQTPQSWHWKLRMMERLYVIENESDAFDNSQVSIYFKCDV